MTVSQLLCVSVIFFGACALLAEAEDLSKYPFIVKPPPTNISCYDCDNYSSNKNRDKERYAVLNNLCETDPGRVTLFRKRCPSRNAKGCAMIKTEYTEFSSTETKRRIVRVRRFCTDELLEPACEIYEGSRGTNKLCTCSSDFCNPASALLPSFGLLTAVVLVTRLL